MIISETILTGAYVIEPKKIHDERGFFARTWCHRELSDFGLDTQLAQCSVSFNKTTGTLRGMHYQEHPHSETKIIACLRGSIHDVIIDLRPDSPTYMDHLSVVLESGNLTMLYVPKGFAHGFQTLEDDTMVYYQISEYHQPGAARGIRWNDPAFSLEWAFAPPRIVSRQDMQWPDYA